MLIAEAIPQGTTTTGSPDLIGIYLCPARVESYTDGDIDPLEYTTRMVPAQSTPNRKLVVFPPVGGVYEAMYGPILDPVEGDYSTGSADPESSRPLRAIPNLSTAGGDIGRASWVKETGWYPGSTVYRCPASGGLSRWTAAGPVPASRWLGFR